MLRSDELERLSRHVARELDPEETARLEAELAQSAELREELRRMQALASLTDDLASGDDPQLDAAIERAVVAAHPAQARARARMAFAIAASLLILCGLAAWWRAGTHAEPRRDELANGANPVPAHALPSADNSIAVEQPGNVFESAHAASAVLEEKLGADGHARFLLGADTRLVHAAPRVFRLEQGTAMIEADALQVAAGALALELHGLAVVSMEPLQALAQVTLATRSTHEGDTMRDQLSGFVGKAPRAVVGAAVALWMVSGEARANIAGQAPVTVRAGEVLSSRTGAPTIVAAGKTDGAKPAAPAAANKGATAALHAEGGPDGKCGSCTAPIETSQDERTILEGNSPTRGPGQALVTIVEFTDYECPFCKKVNDTMLALEKLYGSKVRFVFKQAPLPFHPHARLAAEAVLAANEQGKFWEYRKLLYGGETVPERAGLDEYARQLGLDMGRFDAALDGAKFDAQIKADLTDIAHKKSADGKPSYGTPLFFINGRPLVGAQPIEQFIALIDEELAAQDR